MATDPQVLEVAEAVYQAFGDSGTEGGLTRCELAAACSGSISPADFESRFDMFISMGLLRRNREKAHQQRYVLNPTSVAALLVYERLRDVGGVQEISELLDRTRQDLIAGKITHEQLTASLTRARRGLSISAGHLRHLVRARPWEELLAERIHHRSADQLLAQAQQLVTLVADLFPDLAGLGTRLIGEALRYSAIVNEFCDRLLEQAGLRRDFSMLLPEQYLSAALGAGPNALAAVLERTVFDPARLSVTVEQIVQAVDEHQPRPAIRRPPRPPAMPPGPDPILQARRRSEDERRRLAAELELHLQGESQTDITSRLRAASWRGAARIVADVLRAHADSLTPVQAELSKALIVDPLGPVSHITPIVIRRVPAPSAPTTLALPAEDSGAAHV